jgi:hypothetical protein
MDLPFSHLVNAAGQPVYNTLPAMVTSFLRAACTRQAGACLLVLLCLPGTGAAQTHVLFVGDSFTHGKYAPVRNYNAAAVTDENYGLPPTSPRYESMASEPGPWGGIPGIFKKFTDEAGLSYEVHLEAISAKSLQYHYDNALAVIAQPIWQKVVLQELSTKPLPTSRGGDRPSFYSAVTSLEQAIHAASPTAQVYLYQTWARADLTYPTGAPYAGLPVDSMTQDLHRGYAQAATLDGHITAVAPVGDAWLQAIAAGLAQRNPYSPVAGQLDLWASDYLHPSAWGSYLNTCVLFYQLTGTDPRTLGTSEQAAAALGIAPATAVALQQVAYQQVAAVALAATAPQAGIALSIWPNPARTQVQVAGLPPGQLVSVYDTLGKLLVTGVAPATGPAQLALPAPVAAGLYVVRGPGWARQLAVE